VQRPLPHLQFFDEIFIVGLLIASSNRAEALPRLQLFVIDNLNIREYDLIPYFNFCTLISRDSFYQLMIALNTR
jgi:hypothetical protein